MSSELLERGDAKEESLLLFVVFTSIKITK